MEKTTLPTVSREILQQSMTYKGYRELIEIQLANNKSTGNNHSEEMVHYTQLNTQRMKRLDKTSKLLPETIERLEAIASPKIWLVLSEGWCGDAAQILPVVNKMAEISDNIEVRFILRDENLEVMDQFLTNGGRSIPKILQLNEGLEVEAHWGPRPVEVQAMILDRKKEKGGLSSEDYQHLMVESQKWYLKDKTHSSQREILAALGI